FANCIRPRGHHAHVEVVVAKARPKRSLHLHLVFDDQNPAAHDAAGTRARGNVKLKRGPRLRFSTRMTPPCASTTLLEMARPRPVSSARRSRTDAPAISAKL